MLTIRFKALESSYPYVCLYMNPKNRRLKRLLNGTIVWPVRLLWVPEGCRGWPSLVSLVVGHLLQAGIRLALATSSSACLCYAKYCVSHPSYGILVSDLVSASRQRIVSHVMEYAHSAEFEWIEGFGTRIEEFRGEGQLTLPDGPAAACAFDCVQLADGRILAECHLMAGAVLELVATIINEPPRANWRLEGRTLEGFNILFKEARSQSLELSMGKGKPARVLLACNEVNVFSPAAVPVTPARLTYGLANLEFLGDEVTEFEIEGRRGWSRNTFRFQAASTEIIVRQVDNYRQAVAEMKARRTLAVTAEASLELTRDVTDLEPYDEMMDAVCVLLSLAKGSRVTWLYSKAIDQDGALASMRIVSELSPFWVPGVALIGGATAKELKELVADAYQPYLQEKERFNLPVAIGYYLASKSEIEWNTKFLLACIALETLVGNFAEHGTQGDLRYIIPRKDFEERNTLASLKSLLGEVLREKFPGLTDIQVDDALVKVQEMNRRSLRRLVKRMLAELEIEHDDLSFIALRGRVVHAGTLAKSFHETFGHYSNLICLLDKIFLKVLRYEGEYLDYSKQLTLIE